MDQEISLSRVKLYLQNISLWNSAKNYSNFFFKLSTAVNPEEYFNTYQTYFQLFPTVKSALHAVYLDKPWHALFKINKRIRQTPSGLSGCETDGCAIGNGSLVRRSVGLIPRLKHQNI